MSFDLKKYLIENGLTINSSKNLREYKKETKLQKLKNQLKAIQRQYGMVDGELPSTGVGFKDLQRKKNYIKIVGNLPQRIKDLEDKERPKPKKKPSLDINKKEDA